VCASCSSMADAMEASSLPPEEHAIASPSLGVQSAGIENVAVPALPVLSHLLLAERERPPSVRR
jgi:hypothetical protein